MFVDFDKAFHPEQKWQHIKLSDCSPCKDCEAQKERIDNRYLHMMSMGSDDHLVEQCRHCIKHILWVMDCVQKLKWYEGHDERLK